MDADTCTGCHGNGRIEDPPTCSCDHGYYETGVKDCGNCLVKCSRCTNGTECTLCAGNRINSTCDCPVGTYENSTPSCPNCHYKCATCSNGNTFSNCLSCLG